MPKTISSFTGEYRFLSNFYPAFLEIGGWVWRTSEHAYQAAKSLDPQDWKDIQECVSPGAAKRMGRVITIRPDWEEIKLSIMEEIVTEKFHQNPDLLKKLLDTGNAELIENNHWGDTFWGVCRGVGENHLGKILMRIRSRAQIHQKMES